VYASSASSYVKNVEIVVFDILEDTWKEEQDDIQAGEASRTTPALALEGVARLTLPVARQTLMPSTWRWRAG
jgi:hypothetical protein